MSDQLLSALEVAELLGLSYRTVLRRIEAGILPAVKVGITWAVRESDIRLIVKKRRGRPVKPL